MFDHQISRFEKRIADLPDQPTLAPDALKAWFDSAPEQLRQAAEELKKQKLLVQAYVMDEIFDKMGGGAVKGDAITDLHEDMAADGATGKEQQCCLSGSVRFSCALAGAAKI